MLRRMTPWVLLLLLGGAAVGSLAFTQLPRGARQERESLYPFELSTAEVAQARALAEANPDLGRGKVVFVKVTLLPDSRAGTEQRQVTVTHYRYEGDMTVDTHVDLRAAQVLGIDYREHAPTALAEAEKARVLELIQSDRRLLPLFGTHGEALRVEMRPTRPASQQDPAYGHRLALLAFGVGDTYLRGPTVVVDLTTEQVHVEPAAP
jgi:hypothetical protein